MAPNKKFTLGQGLGRGLDALISTEAVRTSGSSSIGEIELAQIEANPNQPRREFDKESLQELASKIYAGIVSLPAICDARKRRSPAII